MLQSNVSQLKNILATQGFGINRKLDRSLVLLHYHTIIGIISNLRMNLKTGDLIFQQMKIIFTSTSQLQPRRTSENTTAGQFS